MFPTSQHFPPMEYTDPNLQNQTYWQQPGHCVPNVPRTQLPFQPLQQPSFSHQPKKPPKLNLTATTENYDIDTDIDIDSSNYKHETNDAGGGGLVAPNQET
jgi:hypothetical protein